MYKFYKDKGCVVSWLVCVVMLYLLVPSLAYSSDRVRVCNDSETQTLLVATVNNYSFGGQELWKEAGWYTVGAQNCEVVSNITPFYAVGFAFQITDDDTIYNPVVKFDNFAAQKTLRMCADPRERFTYSRKQASEVGANCPENAYRARVSLFITAGNKFETRILYVDPDDYVNAESLLDPNGVTDIEDIDEDATISNSDARQRYEEACYGGHIDACMYAGNFFLYGEGGPRDVPMARKLYEKACEYGSSNGCNSAKRLGGISPTEKKEIAEREQAAREEKTLRNMQQQERLRELYKEGLPSPPVIQ